MEHYDERMILWVEKLKALPPEEQAREMARVERDFYVPVNPPRLSYCEDLSRVPAPITETITAQEAGPRTKERIKALLCFIRKHYGKRCAQAAGWVMQGCRSGKEVGYKMGITRQSADVHLRKLQSEPIQQRAVELGLVTRQSLIASLQA